MTLRFVYIISDSDVTLRDNTLELVKTEVLGPCFPTEADLQGMAVSLNRIQSIYLLDVRDLSRGAIRGRPTPAKLTREELLFLATDRMKGDLKIKLGMPIEYALAVEWLEVAYE